MFMKKINALVWFMGSQNEGNCVQRVKNGMQYELWNEAYFWWNRAEGIKKYTL